MQSMSRIPYQLLIGLDLCSLGPCELQIREWLKISGLAHQYFDSYGCCMTLVKHGLSCWDDGKKKVSVKCTWEQQN